MKNSIFCIAAVALLSTAFTSCKKEATFKELLVGNWKSVQVTAGTNDFTNSNSFDLSLQSSEEFDLDVTAMVPFTGKVVQSYNGDWTTDDKKQDVTLTYNGSGETKTWEVVAIDETSMTAELIENNERYQVKFEKQ